MLNEVSNRHHSGGLFSYFVITTLLSFFVYSTIFVVCNPDISSPMFDSYSEICDSFILPVYHETRNYWHMASEKITLDVLPYYGNRVATRAKLVKQLTKDTVVHTFNKAIKQGSDVKVPIEKLVDPIHPLDPEAPKTSSTTSVKPLPDSTTSVTKQRHPHIDAGNRKARPIVDAEEIMKHANDKVSIEKTFPTVKPKTFEHTKPIEVVSTEARPTVIADSPKKVFIESIKPKPIITTVDSAPEPVISSENSFDKIPVTEENVEPEKSTNAVEEVQEVVSQMKSSTIIPPSAATISGAADSVAESSPLAVETTNETIINPSVDVEPIPEPTMESIADPATEHVPEPAIETVTESAIPSATKTKSESTTKVSEEEGQDFPEMPNDDFPSISSDKPSIPSEEPSVPIEQDIVPEPVQAATVSETTVDANLAPTPSVADEFNEANVNYAPTETFSSLPPSADHVTLRDDRDSYEKGKNIALI